MEDYERHMRREREQRERQLVQTVDHEPRPLFEEPRRLNPSEVDDTITNTLGDYAQARDLIGLYSNNISGNRPGIVLPGIVPTTSPLSSNSATSSGSGSYSTFSSSSSSQQQQSQRQPPPHHYAQPPRQPSYIKQADNKPPYNGRGGYPGQPVKNDIRSSSGMAPPKGPPPGAGMLKPPSTTQMPNGRSSSSASSAEKSYLGPPVPSSSQNGGFSQPQIPKFSKKPPSDINKIINEINDVYRAPAPLTAIAATPHTTIVENYNLNAVNKNKYAFLPEVPMIEPLNSPPAAIKPISELPPSPPMVYNTAAASGSGSGVAALPAPIVSAAPLAASATHLTKESPLKNLKTEKNSTPTLEKQNST